MIFRFVVTAALTAVLAWTASAAVADEAKDKVSKGQERHRVETFDRESRALRAPDRRHVHAVRIHHRHGYRRHRYGFYPRRHVVAVPSHGFHVIPVHYTTVTYRTFVYDAPIHASLWDGYPPYAHVYSLTPGPIYNKPCLC